MPASSRAPPPLHVRFIPCCVSPPPPTPHPLGPPTPYADNWLSTIMFSNVFALTLVVFCYIKGHLFPSKAPNGATDVNICGNVFGDMYKVRVRLPSACCRCCCRCCRCRCCCFCWW